MLTAAASLTLGNLRYDTHAVALRLRREKLPATDRLDVVLPAGVRFEAAPGDPVVLDLDGGEGSARVFTGTLFEVRRALDSIAITARGPAHALGQARPVLALERATAGDAIRALCDEAGIDTGTIEDGPQLALYALDGRATALAEIARLAALSGMGGAFDGDGALHVTPFGGPEAEIAIRHGREIITAEMRAALDDAKQPYVMGEGANAAGKPRARLLAADFAAGGAPADARRFALPELRTTDDARAAAGAIAHARARAARRVRLTTFLLPEAAPGLRIETQDMPEAVPLAELRVEQVTHRLRADGAALTDIIGSGITGPSLADLAGAIAGALP
jgi:hypothetical protein